VLRDPAATDVAPEVAEACETAIDALRSETGGEVREVELPGLELATAAAVLMISAESLHGMSPEKLNHLHPDLSPLARGTLKYRMLLPAGVTVQAGRLRTMMRRRLATLFQDVDVIAWPTVPAPAPPLEAPMVRLPSGEMTADQANIRGAALANLTGIPGISLPAGFSGDGMPIGLQLQAAWGEDELLLNAAEALERANGRRWVESLPPMAGAEQTAA
jgi:aspartyl-tRNA(Asn)/glutamyl-tRNA(Gln) amidotransferase subunit A